MAWPASLSSGPRGPRFLRIGSILLLVAALALIQYWAVQRAQRPYRLDHRGARGLLLLQQWLQEMGYSVTTTAGPEFRIPEEADVLFVYPPSQAFTVAEAQALERWVRQGGTLVLVAADDPELRYTFRYRSVLRTERLSRRERLVLPLLPAGPPELVAEGAQVPRAHHRAALPVVVEPGDGISSPVVSLVPWPEGRVWLLASGYEFTNQAFSQPGQAELLLAILARTPPGNTVAFDTFHLDGPTAQAPETAPSIQEWLYRTPVGWALLLWAGLLALALALQGRRLGPPLPAPQEATRREAGEYVMAMAHLYRRSRAVETVAEHLRRRLKRGLGRPWGLSSDLPDQEFLARLQDLDPHRSPQEWAQIQRMLAELDRRPGDARLLVLADEIDRLLTSKPIGTARDISPWSSAN